MFAQLKRAILALELEERILNIGALLAVVGVVLPWFSGPWGGQEEQTFSGFSFFTSFIGTTVFLLQLVVLATTLLPMFGVPSFITAQRRHSVRLSITLLAAVLTVAALTVLTKVTLEFARMELRFGIYVTLIGSLVSLLYAILLYREHRRSEVRELFHHPEDLFHQVSSPTTASPTFDAPPPPPPPPPMQPEEHPVIR